MAKSHQEVELDSIIIASHLARYVPTSLSLDNLHFLYNENRNNSKMRSNQVFEKHESFIPPNPKVNTQVKQQQKSETSSKFAFLLKNNAKNNSKETKKITIAKFQYELPNVKKVFTPIKTNKPLMVVSLSAENLSSISKPTVKGSKQIESSDYSDYSSDYSDTE